jgi:hypothetical protein
MLAEVAKKFQSYPGGQVPPINLFYHAYALEALPRARLVLGGSDVPRSPNRFGKRQQGTRRYEAR